jgi:hypothetical protein
MFKVSATAAGEREWATLVECRRRRADHYFNTVLEDQQQWYSRKAAVQKLRYQGFAVLVVLLGVCRTIGVSGPGRWVSKNFCGLSLSHVTRSSRS